MRSIGLCGRSMGSLGVVEGSIDLVQVSVRNLWRRFVIDGRSQIAFLS